MNCIEIDRLNHLTVPIPSNVSIFYLTPKIINIFLYLKCKNVCVHIMLLIVLYNSSIMLLQIRFNLICDANA